MKNKVGLIVACVFAAVMVLAAVLYPKLSEKYSIDSTSDNKISDAVIQADDFTVYDSQMNEVKLSDYFGKPIVINSGRPGAVRVSPNCRHLILFMRNIRTILCFL